MVHKTFQVSTRLEEKAADWYKKRMLKTQRSSAFLLRDLIDDRILLENCTNPLEVFLTQRGCKEEIEKI